MKRRRRSSPSPSSSSSSSSFFAFFVTEHSTKSKVFFPLFFILFLGASFYLHIGGCYTKTKRGTKNEYILHDEKRHTKKLVRKIDSSRNNIINNLNHECRTIIWIAQGEVQRGRVRRGWRNWTNAISSDETEQIHQKFTFVWVTDCPFSLSPILFWIQSRFVTVGDIFLVLVLLFFSI